MKKIVMVICIVLVLLFVVGCNAKILRVSDLFQQFDYSSVQFRIGINEEVELSSISKSQIEQLDRILKLKIAHLSDDENIPRPGEYAKSVVIHFMDLSSTLFIGKDRIKVIVINGSEKTSKEYEILDKFDYDMFVSHFECRNNS